MQYWIDNCRASDVRFLGISRENHLWTEDCRSGSVTDCNDVFVERAAAGDGEALAALLRTHGPTVRRRLTIRSAWQGTFDAADVMQVSYLEAHLRIRQLTGRTEAAFVAWLTQLAENNLRDAVRELEAAKRPDPRRRLMPANAEESCGFLLAALAGSTITASRKLANHEAQSLLETALRRLPESYRRVVQLFDLEGRPVAEIAGILQRSPGAVYMLRARAHDQLRELLGTPSRFF